MGRLYLLFKTDEFVVKDIVAVHESLEVLLALIKNNHELTEPKRLGQGWEIDLMTYDDTGKANLTLVNKFKKELVNCRQNDIQEGCYYNIIYKNKDGHDYKCLCKTRGIGKTKCIKSKPHEKIIDTTLNRAPEIYGGLKSYYSTDPSTECKNGLEHLHKRNYFQAHICFLRATQAGYPEGQYRLGGLYLYGRGVKQDLNMAEVLFCTAAENGFLPEATDALGIVKRYREKHR